MVAELSLRELRRRQMIENLGGTGLFELFLIVSLVPLTNFTRSLVNIFLLGPERKQFSRPALVYAKLLLDFLTIIVPYTLSLLDVFPSCVPIITILVGLSIGIIAMLFQYQPYIAHKAASSDNVSNQQQSKASAVIANRNNFDDLYYPYFNAARLSCVSQMRGYTTFLTSFAILAVDFWVFPRRHAKTENYGYSLMDTGVMWYVFCNAAVDPACKMPSSTPTDTELTKKGAEKSIIDAAHRRAWIKTLVAVVGMTVLGIIRICAVKAVNYHEHVSEYGPLWNFFFTLAIVVLAARLVFSTFGMHVKYSLLLGVCLVALYEILLITSNQLESLTRIVHVIKADLERDVYSSVSVPSIIITFINALLDFTLQNRAGIFSCVSYAAVYFICAYVSYLIHSVPAKQRRCCYDYIRLSLVCGMAGVVLAAASQAALPFSQPSRRLGNASYTAYNVGLLLWSMSLFFCLDLLGIMLREFCLTPFYQQARSPVQFLRKFMGDFMSSRLFADIRMQPTSVMYEEPCLMDALNRKMLPVFLAANVATGAVNLIIDTTAVRVPTGTAVLLGYSAALCLPVALVYARNWNGRVFKATGRRLSRPVTVSCSSKPSGENVGPLMKSNDVDGGSGDSDRYFC